MTAKTVIEMIEALPEIERGRVFEYIDTALEDRENQIDIAEARKALADTRLPTPLREFLRKHGLD